MYEIRARRPNANPAGSIIARMRAYVGLQLLKTGPSANHINAYLAFHFFVLLLFKSWFDLLEKPSLVDRFFQRFGKIVIIQSAIIIPHEKAFQKLGGTPIRTVLTLSMSENNIIEILSDPMIISGIFLLFPSSALAHITIGSSGSTHGARTVKTHERNAIIKSVIIKRVSNNIIRNSK